ncbi:DEAD/DEAH box helicase family protein [Salsuginibacillus halophilus]|nr:DEAD/DEAH box helicase family protein [Salsuginibacillus halophilus]
MSKDIELITYELGRKLEKEIDAARGIYILTSFVMKSGVDVLKPALERAVQAGKEIKICAGDYLYVTQPEALASLMELGEGVELRLWHSRGRSFHPKAYLFEQQLDEGTFIVGSSNMSASALTSGVEWNLSVNSSKAPETFAEAMEKFRHIFHAEQTVPLNPETLALYRKAYEKFQQKNPAFATSMSEAEERQRMLPGTDADVEQLAESKASYETAGGPLTPRPAQQEALDALETTVAEEYNKAMVVMATGLGKTYLSAFFAQGYKRVLFIAHREEILKQSEATFNHVLPERSSGLYYNTVRDYDRDMVFASIFTLSGEQHLHRFDPDAFDLIVIDEFHHAAAPTYQRVLSYFQPEFLLGLTATPDRLDGQDVYAICDGNVAYHLHFLEAIRRGWLAPFHYKGVYDIIDYSQITWLGSKYDDEELLSAQMQADVAEHMYQAWLEHKQSRTLVFCSRRRQSEFLAAYFREQGINAVALDGATDKSQRALAVAQLEAGDIEVIFNVDLFTEGTDIPMLDTIMFARPTESLSVFTQQLGRGLRIADDKDYCVIIDFIGNYRQVDAKMALLDERPETERQKAGSSAVPTVPEPAAIHLDLQTVDLLQELKKKKQPRKQKIYAGYTRLKQELGRRPTYLEMHLYGDEPAKAIRQEFKSYTGFLHWAEELTGVEAEVYQTSQAWLIEVEKTAMTKSYKMVLMKVMLERTDTRWYDPITPVDAAKPFHDFFMEKAYRRNIDFSDKTTKKLHTYEEKGVARLIAEMPMTKWAGSAGDLIEFDGETFKINVQPETETTAELLKQWTEEIVTYRLHSYFERKGEK